MEELFTYDTNKTSSGETARKVDDKWFMLSPRQSLQVKTKNELIDEYHGLSEVPGWKEYYRDAYEEIYGKKFQASEKFIGWISQDGFTVADDVHVFETKPYGYIEIPLSFVKIVNMKKIEEELAKLQEQKKSKKEEERVYSIFVSDKDKDKKIMEEMIAKVDKDIMYNIFCIANGNREVHKDVVDIYLEKWARAKYEFYLLFGNELKIEEEREMVMDTHELDLLIMGLKNKFKYPMLQHIHREDYQTNSVTDANLYNAKLYDSVIEGLYEKFYYYVPMIKMFTMEDFTKGKIPANEQILKYFEGKYKEGDDLWKFIENEMPKILQYIEPLKNISKIRVTNGMKLSKFLSKLFNDDAFDIELSKVLQNRVVKGKLALSINPIDYLVMSMNKHGWSSCQRVVDGCYSSAPFSYMLDDTTLVSYIHNGTKYQYNDIKFNTASGGEVRYGDGNRLDFGKYAFEYLSFKSRELVYIDKKTCGCAFTLGYCNMSEETYKTIRLFTEHAISNYLHIEEKWRVARPSKGKNQNRDINQKYRARSRGSHVYLDPIQAFAYVKDATNIYDTEFHIGTKGIPCIVCGNDMVGSGSAKWCGHCSR